MPQRILVQKVTVNRNGKNVYPKIGESFNFTAEELDDINKVNPDAVRMVVVDGETKEQRLERQAREAEAEKLQKAEAAEAKRKADAEAKVVAAEAKKKAEAEAKGATAPKTGKAPAKTDTTPAGGTGNSTDASEL